MRPKVEQLESRDCPSAGLAAGRTTLGPRGRDLQASEIRLAEMTIHKEVALVMKDGAAGKAAALNILQGAAEQLAAVLNPPPS